MDHLQQSIEALEVAIDLVKRANILIQDSQEAIAKVQTPQHECVRAYMQTAGYMHEALNLANYQAQRMQADHKRISGESALPAPKMRYIPHYALVRDFADVAQAHPDHDRN